MYLCKFGQNPPTGSEYNAPKRSYADANGIHAKTNMPPPHPSVWVGHNYQSYILKWLFEVVNICFVPEKSHQHRLECDKI